MPWLALTVHHALVMLWETYWALVLGFALSAALQTLVSREQMSRALGSTNLRTMALATGLGAASSSCSYAAAAAAHSAVRQGAALVPALAFMFASTNLVIELGAVLWVLMGWHFVLAEFAGAFVLIGCVWAFTSWFMPQRVQDEARRRAPAAGHADHCHHQHHDQPQHHGATETAPVAPADPGHCHDQGRPRHGTSPAGGKLREFAAAFFMDWRMLWKEILGGFFIAGFLMTVVPPDAWARFFMQSGNGALRLLENALVGPLIAIASFVCSVGNIPLASLLWAQGIRFGGVLAFIYADLLVVPLILIYVKYYGARAAAWMVAIFYGAMVLAGIVVDLLFTALGLVPGGPRPPSVVEQAQIRWNYTSWLDLVALIVFGALLLLSRTRPAVQADS